MHLNTFFLWLFFFILIEVKCFLIENIFFDWSEAFCVWAILSVRHLCLYYSIPQKMSSIKKYIFNPKLYTWQSKRIIFQTLKKNETKKMHSNTLLLLIENTFFGWSILFFLIEAPFFLVEAKKVLKSFFFWLKRIFRFQLLTPVTIGQSFFEWQLSTPMRCEKNWSGVAFHEARGHLRSIAHR